MNECNDRHKPSGQHTLTDYGSQIKIHVHVSPIWSRDVCQLECDRVTANIDEEDIIILLLPKQRKRKTSTTRNKQSCDSISTPPHKKT